MQDVARIQWAGRGSRLRMIASVVVAIAATALPALAAGATPEAIRACVERNLVRYTAPGSAVVAQYTDLETACIAALDGSAVGVEFTPDSGDSQAGSEEGGGGASADGTGGASGEPGSPAPGTTGEPGAAPARGDSNQPTDARPSSEAAPGSTPSTTELVRRSANQVDASAGSPLPGTLSDLPAWLWVVLAAVAALMAAGVAVGVRRRLR